MEPSSGIIHYDPVPVSAGIHQPQQQYEHHSDQSPSTPVCVNKRQKDESIVSTFQVSFSRMWNGLSQKLFTWTKHHTRSRLKKLISTQIFVLRQALIESDLKNTKEAVQSRSELWERVGDFGVILFSPLDAPFHIEPKRSEGIAQEKECFLQKKLSFQLLSSIFSSYRGNNELDSETNDTVGYDTDTEEIPITLDSESPEDLINCPPILNQELMQELSDRGLPLTCQGRNWIRLYSVARDGDSFTSFLRKVKDHSKTLIVVQTDKDVIFGGFATSTWERQKGHDGKNFYGSGQAFLFSVMEAESKETSNCKDDIKKRIKHSSSLTKMPSFQGKHSISLSSFPVIHDEGECDSDSVASSISEGIYLDDSDKKQLNIYRWTGKNNYNQLIHVNESRIAMGGGGSCGTFGLCIEDSFLSGSSGSCETFDNPPLALGRDKDGLQGESYFEVVGMEVYGFKSAWD
eukprot:CAMPEP_0178977998 /NCGR_PEP_ID=MMETSP0789-20121207/24861_1 /TAXON_ID=3005 /ORGANISM="Rhizosolenia setigera, Strain CCMP 1694" /LENGTH=459 /DNA_ID=CAMNT_0020667581 /DNA_START=364 /DNA_END=1743 /DNA_ORIENTATION=-